MFERNPIAFGTPPDKKRLPGVPSAPRNEFDLRPHGEVMREYAVLSTEYTAWKRLSITLLLVVDTRAEHLVKGKFYMTGIGKSVQVIIGFQGFLSPI